ncbi:hypothetical protein NESM_000772300 [Novymonas esmeraldas]|uniref:Uncharacterized protein n=1 Tax=Novymonas esmeraldas TaxID=1808958 RepID=A0AAW0EXD8_9TRYP
MSSTAYGDGSPYASPEEEEEEEELGLPRSSGLVCTAETAVTPTAVSTSNSIHAMPTPPSGVAAGVLNTADADDEFGLDLSFVTSKGRSPHASLRSAAPSRLSTATQADSTPRPRWAAATASSAVGALSTGERGGPQMSIAGRWERAENESLNNYHGSDRLDDTDRPHDDAEFQAWKARCAFRKLQVQL